MKFLLTQLQVAFLVTLTSVAISLYRNYKTLITPFHSPIFLALFAGFRENVTSLFTKDKRGLAEKREIILDSYLCNLLRQPERVGSM